MSRRREVLTPEGVPLHFEVAGIPARAAAFALDLVLIAIIGVCLLVLVGMLVFALGHFAVALGFLLFFLVRCCYFPWFEARGRGATPGKRALGLRVIDAHGGPLSGEAVLARNLTREIEVFLPLVAALAPEQLLPDMPAWARALALVWVVALALLPLLSHDRLRAGDLLAGTLVVHQPKTRLLEDLSVANAAPGEPALRFTPQQLDLYGIHELQVLEDLLRRRTSGREATLLAVAEKIQAKISWDGPRRTDAELFLTAFYAAQREHLERRMLLGERRERKRAPAASASRRP